MRGFIFFVFFAVLGCQKPDPMSPEGAFQNMAQCVDKGDARCLYDKLDMESRWSIQTIHKYLREASTLVNKSYPADQKRNAYGSWLEEALASDPETAFEAWCAKRRCLEQFAKGFGAIIETKKIKSDTVVVETTRGQSFEMFFGEGRWGLVLFRDELQQGKLRTLDRLEQIRKNAAEFDEQRMAVEDEQKSGQSEQGE